MLLNKDHFSFPKITMRDLNLISRFSTSNATYLFERTEIFASKLNLNLPVESSRESSINFKKLCGFDYVDYHYEIFFIFQTILNYFRILDNMEKISIVYDGNFNQTKIFKLNGLIHLVLSYNHITKIEGLVCSNLPQELFEYAKMFHLISKIDIKQISNCNQNAFKTFIESDSLNVSSFIFSKLGLEYLQRREEPEIISLENIKSLLNKFSIDKKTLDNIKNLIES